MPDRDEALLAMEAARVLALKHGIVEHQSGADEVDAVKRYSLPASGFFPLEHSRPLRAVRVLVFSLPGLYGGKTIWREDTT